MLPQGTQCACYNPADWVRCHPHRPLVAAAGAPTTEPAGVLVAEELRAHGVQQCSRWNRPALNHHLGPVSPAPTAETRARSDWLSFSLDASLSGRCSLPVLPSCPALSGAGKKRDSSELGDFWISRGNTGAKIREAQKIIILSTSSQRQVTHICV